MSRTVLRRDAHVIVYPSNPWNQYSRRASAADIERERTREAERLADEARRHLDDFMQVSVVHETVTLCSNGIDRDSEGNSLGHWPSCCEADQAEFYADHADKDDDWFWVHGLDDPEYLAEFRAGLHPHRPENGDPA